VEAELKDSTTLRLRYTHCRDYTKTSTFADRLLDRSMTLSDIKKLVEVFRRTPDPQPEHLYFLAGAKSRPLITALPF
jgi:hypothetical protein